MAAVLGLYATPLEWMISNNRVVDDIHGEAVMIYIPCGKIVYR